MSVEISAVICTHNRAAYLRKAIRSLCEQTLDPGRYEVIIVDNGSTDDTKDVVLAAASLESTVCWIFEPALGLNNARNTGWRNAVGEYVAYLDDDAVANPDWLERILDAYQKGRPMLGCVGGRIEPIWEAPRPAWLTDWLAIWLAVSDRLEEPVYSETQQLLAGANMALPRALVEAEGGFSPRLDRTGRSLMSNGDVMMQLRTMRRGYACFYDPAIAVKHHIHASRLTKKWFVRRLYMEGVSGAIMLVDIDSLSATKRCRQAVREFRQFLGNGGIRQLFAGGPADAARFEGRCRALKQLGFVVGCLRA